MTTGAWIAAAALSLTSAGLVQTIVAHRDSRLRREYVAVVRAFRWWMIPAAVGLLMAVAIASVVLLQVPVLQASWWRLVSGQTGSVVGQSGFHGGLWTFATWVIPAVLFVVLPSLAYMEEWLFRRGSETKSRTKVFVTQLAFGLAHCVLAGIPLGIGLVLTFVGYSFLVVYLKHIDRAEILRLTNYLDNHQNEHDEAIVGHHRRVEAWVAAWAADPGSRRPKPEFPLLNLNEIRDRKAGATDRIDELQREGLYASAAFHATYNAIAVLIGLAVLTAQFAMSQ